MLAIYLASVMAAGWGIAHLFATTGVVKGFGDISLDNRRIITMEWIVEGVALLSTGAFVAVVTMVAPGNPASAAVYGVAITTLLVLAGVSLATGFKIAFLPFRLCPFIFSGAAILIAWGAWG